MEDMHYGKNNMEVNGKTMNKQQLDHYIHILQYHDKQRTPWNERAGYWIAYNEQQGNEKQ